MNKNDSIEVRKMIKEVLKEEGVIDEIIDGIFKASEKSGFDCFGKEKEEKVKTNDNSYDTEIDYKGYFECLPILIDFIKGEKRIGNKKAFNVLTRWDNDRPGPGKVNE